MFLVQILYGKHIAFRLLPNTASVESTQKLCNPKMQKSAYTEFGWKLTFAKPREKNPGTLMQENWQSKVATSSKDVDSWLKKCPNANVGVLLGPESGIIDVEYDTKEGEAIVEGIIASDPCPTPTYRSGKSIHRLYRWDESLPRETVPKHKGIEWRLNSGNRALQSILPPSIHPSGKRYEWLPGLSPDEVAVSGMPFELWDLCWYAATKRDNNDQTEIDDRGDLYVAQGSRHDWLRDRLFNVAHWGLSQSQLTQVAHVLESEVAHFDPDGRDDRIQKLVRGAVEKRTIKEEELRVGTPAYRSESTTADKLLSKKIVREFAVQNIMVMNEPMIIGGATKSLKTSVMLELAVSIVTGKPFLGEFKIPNPQSVMVISGESGELTIQDFLKSVNNTKGLDASELSDLHISYRLPKLDDPNQVDDLITELKQKNIKIVFIDPLYRSLRVGDAASNVYSMGERLELIAEKIHAAGITPVLLHHFRKQGKSFDEAPDLEDLSQSGIAEFGRQFLLLKRRTAYEQDGNHTLWCQWGGSAGHQGLRILEAVTGTQESGLLWKTTLRTVDEWRDERKKEKEEKQRTHTETKRGEVQDLLAERPGLNLQEISEAVDISARVAKNIVEDLYTTEGENRKVVCFACEDDRDEWVQRSEVSQKEAEVNRQQEILDLLKEQPGLGVREIREALGRNKASCGNYIKLLIEDGKIRTEQGARRKVLHYVN